jgi:proteasome accessory factor A
MIFDTGRDALQRVPMREPLRGTKVHVEDVLDRSPDAATLVDLIRG